MDARPTGQEAQVALSRPGFDPPWGRIAVPKVKKRHSSAPCYLKHRFVAPSHLQGNGHLCANRVRGSEVFLGFGDKFFTLMRNAPGRMIFPSVWVFFLKKEHPTDLVSCHATIAPRHNMFYFCWVWTSQRLFGLGSLRPISTRPIWVQPTIFGGTSRWHDYAGGWCDDGRVVPYIKQTIRLGSNAWFNGSTLCYSMNQTR